MMRAVLDACVLYPTVLRQILTGVAARGLYRPLWSERILEEWARATVKLGPEAEQIARAEIALLQAAFPKACIRAQPDHEARLLLPDPDDVHVLAVAIAASADCIVTFNARDFPRHLLAAEGVERRDPDSLLWELWSHQQGEVVAVVAEVHGVAEQMAGEAIPLKSLMKRAQLPKLAKAMGL